MAQLIIIIMLVTQSGHSTVEVKVVPFDTIEACGDARREMVADFSKEGGMPKGIISGRFYAACGKK